MSFRGLMTGVSGLQSQAKKMEVIGNNLANINTTAFKKGDVQFQELFYDTIKGASSSQGALGGTNPMSVGSGVQIGSINNVFTQGSRVATGRTLDFMIEGQDFFVASSSTPI
jgi:flagellar hook protein FlgE